jgi:flavin-dependent dehydrogenase
MSVTDSPSYDAIVVGARCAGAATAMLLARGGARVLLIDRGDPGTDTLSTHALMRAGVLQLARWGLLDRVIASGAPAVRSATFHYDDDAQAFPIRPRDGVDALYAPRRSVLDAILVAAAREAGVEVRHRTRLADLVRIGGTVRGAVVTGSRATSAMVRAPLVIGADGLRSAVARLVGTAPYAVARNASTILYGYWPDLPADGYHWYWRRGATTGVIPTNDGATCIFVGAPRLRELRDDPDAGFRRVLAESAPELAARLAGVAPDTLRPFAGVPGFLRPAWGPGWALVGDAGYFKDPLTAHGISDALRDAELLARAVLGGGAGALAEYQETRDALSLDLFAISDEIAGFRWDLPALQGLHRRLSRAMAGEVAHLAALPSELPRPGTAWTARGDTRTRTPARLVSTPGS